MNFSVLLYNADDLIMRLCSAKEVDNIVVHDLNHLCESLIIMVQLSYHNFCVFVVIVIGYYGSDPIKHFTHVEVLFKKSLFLK